MRSQAPLMRSDKSCGADPGTDAPGMVKRANEARPSGEAAVGGVVATGRPSSARPTGLHALGGGAPVLPLSRAPPEGWPPPQEECDTPHPPSFYCPISRQCMRDPVVLADGHTYERRHIEHWLESNHTSPVSGARLPQTMVLPNHALRNAIEEYFGQVRGAHRDAARRIVSGLHGEAIAEHGGLARSLDALMQCILATAGEIHVEQILKTVMEEAKCLIGAEGASVFLVDRQRQELYSTANSSGEEIRMPIASGIAGQVASTGAPALIPKPSSVGDDLLFCNVDAATGFKTRNTLCAPIRASKWGILGVASLVNKTLGGCTDAAFSPECSTAVNSPASELGGTSSSRASSATADEVGAVRQRCGFGPFNIADGVANFTPDDRAFLELILNTAASALCSGGYLERDLCAKSPGSAESHGAKRRRPASPWARGTTPSYAARPSALKVLLAEALQSWEMDALALAELTDNRPLSVLAAFMFENLGLAEQFSMDIPRMKHYFGEIERGYRDNPYHNRAHAASVLHVMHKLLSAGGVAAACSAVADGIDDPSHRVALVQVAGLLAAAVHDFEHEGLSNDFLVKTFSPKALRYNDRNVNENHHVAAAFEVLRRPECNFLEKMPEDEFRKLRSLVVDMVLSTDMADGNAYLAAFKDAIRLSKAASEGGEASPSALKPATAKEAVLGLQIALKCADIGHLSLSWSAHIQWVQRLETEFFLQGDQERKLGMEKVSFMMDRTKPGVSQTQVGFFNFVVIPLFGCLVDAFPGCRPIYDAVMTNGVRWREIEQESSG